PAAAAAKQIPEARNAFVFFSVAPFAAALPLREYWGARHFYAPPLEKRLKSQRKGLQSEGLTLK
ncbi:MAG: hypothetical protein ACI4OS_00970, partial [Akkermansia sp.]